MRRANFAPPRAAAGPSYRLLLEYDGSRFQGWQKQGPKQTAQGVRTVSGTLERVLQEAGVPVATRGGSGRTDAGVHALGQVAHLHLQPGNAPRPRDLQRIFDEGLPGDVAVRSVATCSPKFHARHEAMSRSYLYQISQRRSAFAKPYVWWVKAPMDLRKLEEAWGAFQGAYDLSAFSDLEPGEDPRCQILSSELVMDGSLILLRVVAVHFLRRQVRRMVGAAVHCALGKERVSRIQADLQNPTEAANLYWGASAAPSAGLFLERVRYPGDPIDDPIRPMVAVF